MSIPDKNERQTPRTDAIEQQVGLTEDVMRVVHHARGLEDELRVARILGAAALKVSKENHDALHAALSARNAPAKLPNSCPYCGADTHGGAEWAFWERQFSLEVLALIDEVEAARRGIAVTHAVDPLPGLKERVGTREAIEAADRAMRSVSTDGGSAT